MLFSVAAFAQENPEQVNEKFKEAKLREFVYHLEITDAQKPAFVEVYDRYEAEMKATVGERPRPDKRPETTEEAAALVKERIAHQQKAQDVRLKYVDEFAKVLDARQLVRLYKVENEIQQKLMDRRGQHGPGQGGQWGGPGQGGHRGGAPRGNADGSPKGGRPQSPQRSR